MRSLSQGAGLIRRALALSFQADRRGTWLAAGLQLAGAFVGLLLVLASRLALQAFLGHTEVDGRTVVVLAILALSAGLTGGLAALQQQQQRLLSERVAEHVWELLLDATTAVDLVTWDSTEFMDRLDRVRMNALQRPSSVVSSVFGLIGSALTVALLAGALFSISPVLAVVLLAAGVPAVAVSMRASRAEYAFVTSTNRVARLRSYLKFVMTNRSYAAELRAFDAAPRLLDAHARADVEYLSALKRNVSRRQRLGLVTVLATSFALTTALVVIVWLLAAGQIGVADAGAAAIAARLLGGQLLGTFGSMSSLFEAGPFLSDLEGFLSAHAVKSSPGTFRELADELRLDDVTFAYPGSCATAVDGVTIRLPRGKVVALVGENGSGKTTLAKLAAGLYVPDSGAVTWDGDAISPSDLRASVSVLVQDFVQYQMSARDNIAISRGDQDVEEQGVHLAAKRAGIDEVLEALPAGYDTLLGHELGPGVDLSGGQWQRLALARAFYRDTSLLILDEPSAALDPRAEQELFSDVRKVLDGRAALLISHRYSSVRLADHIYVMDAGKVVESGTHEELVGSGGRYAELYALQAASYLDGSARAATVS